MHGWSGLLGRTFADPIGQAVSPPVGSSEIGCGLLPGDVTQEECIANQVGAYQDSSECVSHYYFDECLATQTCEEIERLSQLNMGDCLDERDEADKVECVP